MCGRMPSARHLRGAGPSAGIRERCRVQRGSVQTAEGLGRAGNHSSQGSSARRCGAKKGSGLLSDHPALIISIVLGIFGYAYGSLLGVFLCGMFTKRRGNNLGNIVAMIIGFVVVAILSGLPNNIAGLFGGKLYMQPGWLPVMEFPWWICFGTIVTFSVAILFRTTRERQSPEIVRRRSSPPIV